MNMIEEIRDLLGDDYIVHDYKAKDSVDVCRKFNVLESEKGDTIIILRICKAGIKDVPKYVKGVLRLFKRYDAGGYQSLIEGV